MTRTPFSLLATSETVKPVIKGSLDDTFEELPVNLTRFVTSKFYLSNPPLSPIQYEAVRYIERIYYPEIYPLLATEADDREDAAYWADPIRMTNLITIQWGKGSGKDHICRIASMRIAYLLLCLRSPQRYYGMPEQDTIHLLNIAPNSPQAESAFFRPMVRAVKSSWFKNKAAPRQGFILYDKNIEAVSGSGDAESQEGGNLLLAVADEIDAFRSKEELERYRGRAVRDSSRSAESILKMIRTSGSTRFPSVYKNVIISYPRYLGSTIQKLTKVGRDAIKREPETSRHYVSGPFTTWDVNPRVIGPEVFAEDYREDPLMARSMYECQPYRAIDTYFKNIIAVRACLTDSSQPIEISYMTRNIRSDVTGQSVLSWEPSYTYDSDFKPITGARYALHADLAVKGDKAGIAMSHVVRMEAVTEQVVDSEGGISESVYDKPVVKTDFVLAYAAEAHAEPPREIQIRWARMLAFDLINRGFNITSFSYDGFQSVDSMQILESHGIEAERVSMDMSEDPWKNWRDLMYEGRHSIPFSQDLLNEIESLGRFNGKVDHPPGGSKDLADAVCGSALGAVVQGGSESEDGEIAYASGNEVQIGYFDTDLAGMDVDDMMSLPVGMPSSFG